MFITLTIDTAQKKKSKQVRFSKTKFNPAKGWRKSINIKKRSMWQKFQSWRRTIKNGQYKLGGQVAMF